MLDKEHKSMRIRNGIKLQRGQFFITIHASRWYVSIEIHHHWKSFDKMFCFAIGKGEDSPWYDLSIY